MGAEMNMGKAGSPALGESPMEVCCVYPADQCISQSLLYGIVLSYTPAAFHWVE